MCFSIKLAITFIILFFSALLYADNAAIGVSNFSENGLSGWQEKSFKGNTQYKIINYQNQKVLEAKSSASASGLYKKMNIDVKTYPYLNWRWLIKNKLNNPNEKVKSGDDFVARIYVIASDGLFFWQKKVICYVWASEAKVDEHWFNPYTGDSVEMVVIKSSKAKINTWYVEKRNVYKDFKLYFGRVIDNIGAVAVMTDTDDTKSSATTFYSDIYFDK